MKNQEVKMVIPCSKAYDFIILSDIIRCEGMQNYTRIFLKDGSNIVSSCNIGLYKKVLEPYNFYSVHKSHLVNEQLIVRYHKEGNVEMNDRSIVPVSRRRREDFNKEVIQKLNILANHE